MWKHPFQDLSAGNNTYNLLLLFASLIFLLQIEDWGTWGLQHTSDWLLLNCPAELEKTTLKSKVTSESWLSLLAVELAVFRKILLPWAVMKQGLNNTWLGSTVICSSGNKVDWVIHSTNAYWDFISMPDSFMLSLLRTLCIFMILFHTAINCILTVICKEGASPRVTDRTTCGKLVINLVFQYSSDLQSLKPFQNHQKSQIIIFFIILKGGLLV